MAGDDQDPGDEGSDEYHLDCVWCHKAVVGFNDELSIKEYVISGLCQSCQDEVFDENNEVDCDDDGNLILPS